MSELVHLDHNDTGHVATITLNRPERLNAINFDLVAALDEVLDEVDHDRQVRVVILTGSGRGFCSGLDLANPGNAEGAADLGRVQRTMANQERIVSLVPKMRSMRQPVIAAINGPAAGAGFALAVAADLRIASTTATFTNAFLNVGLSGCDFGVSFLLPKLIGVNHASHIMLTGDELDADDAHAIGLINAIAQPETLLADANALAERIASRSPFGVQMTKQVLHSNLASPSLESAMSIENRTQALAASTGDFQEAIAAFIERRPPQFTNS